MALKLCGSALALSLLGSGVHAQMVLQPLSQSEIRAALFGKTVTGEYADGSNWAERFNPDGTSNYVDNRTPINGVMTFRGNHLCFTYPENSTVTGGCFEVWKRSANCFDFYGTGDNNFTIASQEQKRFGQGWTARGWYSDQKSTCTTEQIS